MSPIHPLKAALNAALAGAPYPSLGPISDREREFYERWRDDRSADHLRYWNNIAASMMDDPQVVFERLVMHAASALLHSDLASSDAFEQQRARLAEYHDLVQCADKLTRYWQTELRSWADGGDPHDLKQKQQKFLRHFAQRAEMLRQEAIRAKEHLQRFPGSRQGYTKTRDGIVRPSAHKVFMQSLARDVAFSFRQKHFAAIAVITDFAFPEARTTEEDVRNAARAPVMVSL